MPMFSKIEALPIEVINLILAELPLASLKAFRQTCRALAQAPLEHIFGHIRLIIHSQSKLNIAAIARDEQLRSHVRTLSVDLRTFTVGLVYHSWREYCIAVSKRMCPDFEERAQADFRSYVDFVTDQLIYTRFGLPGMCSYFPDLPNLQHLELNGGADHGAETPTRQDFVDFKTLWPSIGTVPHWNGNPLRNVNTCEVLEAGLANRDTLRSLSLDGIDWNLVEDIPASRQARWHEGIRSIQHLKLCLRLPNPAPGITVVWGHKTQGIVDDWAQFLASPTTVHTLDFGLLVVKNVSPQGMPWTCYGYEEALFRAIVARSSFMHHIKELRFSEFVFSPTEFIRLLSENEAGTLKRLSFHSIHLSEGSWLVFLRQLAHAVHLDHFSLSGRISSMHEGWQASTQEKAAYHYGGNFGWYFTHESCEYGYDINHLTHCHAFADWNSGIEPLPERWCIRTLIEDWVTSGGGARQGNNQSKEVLQYPIRPQGSSATYTGSFLSTWPVNSYQDDNFPLMPGYLPICPAHHAPSCERQKQYRYESRWRTRLNGDFTFVWAENLLTRVEERRRGWVRCPPDGAEGRTELCPPVLVEDDYSVPEEIVQEDREGEFRVVHGHLVTTNAGG